MTNTVNPGIYPLVRAPDGRFYSDPTKAPLEGEIRWSQSTIDATGVIDSGVNVLLDTHANPGATLYNSGRIRVSNAYNDVSITLGMYHGEIGGEFIVGTDAEPFEGRLLITVNGAAPSSPATNTGHEKGAMLHGHKWHVRSKYQTPFVCVGANASAGSTVITLRDPPENWKAGDDLALAFSGYYLVEQIFYCKVVSVVGDQLTIDTPLPYDIWGALQYLTDDGESGTVVENGAAGWSLDPDAPFTFPPGCSAANFPTVLDESAVFANLTRPVMFKGATDAAWTAEYFGGHFMIMDLDCDVYIDGMTFYQCGQMGHLGRYGGPHWHMASFNVRPNGTDNFGPSGTTLSTARTLSLPPDTTMVDIFATPASTLRYTTDGTTPTAGVGTLISAGGHCLPILVDDPAFVAVKIIQVSSNGGCKVAYSKGAGEDLGAYDTDKAVFKNSVVWKSGQRGPVVHGTKGVYQFGNVCCDFFGHGFFFEDGVESDNILDTCLSIGAKAMPSGYLASGYQKRMFDHETTPAGFWLTCPKITFTNCIGMCNEGFGAQGAFPVRGSGLSRLVPGMYPQHMQMGDWSHNRFQGNGQSQWMIGGVAKDSIANLFEDNTKYDPRDDETPTGNPVRFRWRRFTLSTGGGGYVNFTGFPDYEENIGANIHGAFFSGTTSVGNGPVDPDTQLQRGKIHRCVGSGPSLKTSTLPTGDGWDFSGAVFMSTYHGTVVAVACVGVNLPQSSVPGRASGFVRIDDVYLSTPTLFTDLFTDCRMINTNFGYREEAPYITGIPKFGFYSTQFSNCVKDKYGYYGTPNKYAIQDYDALTYDAAGLMDCPVAGFNGKLADGPFYGLCISLYDSYPDAYNIPSHVRFRRYDNDWVQVGEIDVPYTTEHGGNTIRFFDVGKGATHVTKVSLELPDVPAVTTGLNIEISNCWRTTDVFELWVPFQTAPTFVGVNAFSGISPYQTGYQAITPSGSLAAMEAIDGMAAYFDSSAHRLYFKLKGGFQASLNQFPNSDEEILRSFRLYAGTT